jgi:hypothetical protein
MTPERVDRWSGNQATRTDRVRGLSVVLAAALLLVGCGPSEREKIERAAKERWHASSATCTHRSEKLYGCVLLRAHIPLRMQFTDDFLSSKAAPLLPSEPMARSTVGRVGDLRTRRPSPTD